MARPLRIEYPGAVYHATSRGNARQDVFLGEHDYLEFLNVLCVVVKRFNWLVHAYCLMGNHYHLLIETPDGNLSSGMRQLNGVYTQRFNRQHNRVGHLMQGRFKAILVDKEAYLAELCRYIVLNPVRAGMKKSPEQSIWSSYRKTAGIGEGCECLTVDWLLMQFAKTRKVAQEKYKEFVIGGIGDTSPWEKLVGQVLLGDEDFIGRMKALLDDKDKIQEIPKAQRYSARPAIDKILKMVKKERATAESVYEAHVVYGYTLKEIALVLGLHYTTVSAMVRTAEGNYDN
jgi:REP element-mobilizing transposase RayT